MILKNMKTIEEFLKNRITFKLCEKRGRFFILVSGLNI